MIDLNPGAGVWSQALHETVQPRKHVMMDLDAELYKPYLGDLLAKDNVSLIAKSGVVWKDLFEMIDTELSSTQTVVSPDTEPKRNDTLLVTANLSTFPKKSYHGFDSVSTMVLYQFMSSIRTASLFQRYGLVRMLIWVNDEDKRRLIPRSIHRRKRSAFEAEVSCDWIHEVASLDVEIEDRTALRDDWINLESACNAVARMAEAGIKMPSHRQTAMYKRIMSDKKLINKKLAGVRPPTLSRPFKQELEELEEEFEQSSASEPSKRLKALRAREKYDQEDAAQYLELLQQRDQVLALAESVKDKDKDKDSTSAKEEDGAFAEADAAWNDRIDSLKKNPRNEFKVLKDSYHLFRQTPPVLLWDRRHYEPLSTNPTEFFPNAPTALLDIQPKAMHALLRQHGQGTSRAGDMSDVMLRFWFHNTLLPIPKAMEGLWGGFGDSASACKSITDPKQGGSPMTGNGALSARCVNEQQWVEIMQAWMNWPFRPSYTQMLGRLADDDAEGDETDAKSGASGLA